VLLDLAAVMARAQPALLQHLHLSLAELLHDLQQAMLGMALDARAAAAGGGGSGAPGAYEVDAFECVQLLHGAAGAGRAEQWRLRLATLHDCEVRAPGGRRRFYLPTPLGLRPAAGASGAFTPPPPTHTHTARRWSAPWRRSC
jgi:hypothetical protein